jgi:hypothetical protein
VAEGNRIIDESASAVAADRPAFKGAGMLQDAVDLGAKVRAGDWTEGLASLASAAYETREFVADPIAKLASMGLGWVIEYFGPVTGLLDSLTGDQQRLEVMVENWSGIADELHGAAQDLHDHNTKDAAGWTGPAVGQYRLFCADRVDLYHSAGATARATADNVGCCASVLSVIREIVRGLLTDAVGKVISIGCRYPPPATPAAAGEISQTVVGLGTKIQQWLDKLQRAFAKAARMMKDGGNLFRDIKEALAHANKLGRMSATARRHVDFLAAAAADLPAGIRTAGRQALTEVPEQLVEKTAIETGKEAVNASAEQAKRPEEPGDPTRLYDGPGPHRVTGTLS